MIGRVSALSPGIQSDTGTSAVPFHWNTLAAPPPSWSMQLDLIGCTRPQTPSSFRRFSSRFRFSRPHWICSPVRGLLPNFFWATRTASVLMTP